MLVSVCLSSQSVGLFSIWLLWISPTNRPLHLSKHFNLKFFSLQIWSFHSTIIFAHGKEKKADTIRAQSVFGVGQKKKIQSNPTNINCKQLFKINTIGQMNDDCCCSECSRLLRLRTNFKMKKFIYHQVTIQNFKKLPPCHFFVCARMYLQPRTNHSIEFKFIFIFPC